MGYALVFQIPCPDPPPEKAFRGSKYSQGILEDFGSLMMLVPWRKYIAVFVTWNVLRSKTGDEHSSQLCGGIPAFSRLEFDSSPCILWPLGSVGRLYIYNIYIYLTDLLYELQTCPLKMDRFKGFVFFSNHHFSGDMSAFGGACLPTCIWFVWLMLLNIPYIDPMGEEYGHNFDSSTANIGTT